MARASKTTVTDMQMRILNGFDRTLRLHGERTSGLMRNAHVSQWDEVPGLQKVMSSHDKKIAKLKAQISEMEGKGF
jgi:hypothetical protein